MGVVFPQAAVNLKLIFPDIPTDVLAVGNACHDSPRWPDREGVKYGTPFRAEPIVDQLRQYGIER